MKRLDHVKIDHLIPKAYQVGRDPLALPEFGPMGFWFDVSLACGIESEIAEAEARRCAQGSVARTMLARYAGYLADDARTSWDDLRRFA